MMLHTKYQGSRPCGFRQEEFFMFPYVSHCKTCDPQGRAILDPRGIVGTNLVKVHYKMLHTKHHGSRSCGFRQEDFFMFSLYKPM